MRRWGWVLVSVIVAGVSLGRAGWPQGSDVVESLGQGTVNWSKGVATATGLGVPPPTAVSPAQARALARRAAEVVARRNLLEVVRGVRIDSQTQVRNAMLESDVINAQVSGLVRGAQVVSVQELGDGSVEVTVGMRLMGELANLLLPQAPRRKVPPPAPQEAGPASSPQIAAPPPPAGQGPARQPVEAQPSPPAPAPRPFTGLVVDARGLGARPAMVPKVLSESGQELYGPASVDRQWAAEQGVAGYAKDPSAAQQHERVADRPLVVKGLQTSGPSRADIVISNADARVLFSSAQNMGMLEKARVIIVVD